MGATRKPSRLRNGRRDPPTVTQAIVASNSQTIAEVKKSLGEGKNERNTAGTPAPHD
jgi:hypothetical protein